MISVCKGLSAAVASIAICLSASCSGGGEEDSTTAGPPPAGVPTAAVAASDEQLGDIAPTPGNADDVRIFESLDCADGIMTIVTSRETVYALISCDRSLPADVAARFEAVPVRIRVVSGDPAKLYLETASQGTAEFTVEGAWIVPAS